MTREEDPRQGGTTALRMQSMLSSISSEAWQLNAPERKSYLTWGWTNWMRRECSFKAPVNSNVSLFSAGVSAAIGEDVFGSSAPMSSLSCDSSVFFLCNKARDRGILYTTGSLHTHPATANQEKNLKIL